MFPDRHLGQLRMSKDHRQEYHRAWSVLTPPLRPHPEVVAAVAEQMRGRSGRALLLGVTPELVDLVPDLVALDRNFSMIANLWLGNTASRWAVVGDWRNPHFAPASFSTCIGDGSLCGLEFPDEIMLVLHELSRVLRSEGRFICRLFLPPETAESVSALKDEAMSGKIRNFHAFKFRLAMAIAAEGPRPRVAVDTILNAFNALFEDRSELVRISGWNRAQIDTIDYYQRSTVVFSFPTRDQLLSAARRTFRRAQFVPTGAYEMADRCPLLVADMA
jgi:SAM-dependent methyltransferase